MITGYYPRTQWCIAGNYKWNPKDAQECRFSPSDGNTFRISSCRFWWCAFYGALGRGGGANAAEVTVLLLVPRLRPPRRRPPPASVAPPSPCRRRILIFLPLVAGTPALQFRLEAVISRSICFRFSLVQITISISIRNQVAVVKLRDECMLPGSVGTIPSPVLLQL